MNNEAIVEKLVRVGRASLILGVVLLAAFFVSGPADKTAGSYLYGWTFWTCVALGMLGLTFLFQSIQAGWGRPLARLYEAGASPATFIVLALLFIPIVLNAGAIYEWVDAAKRSADPIMKGREPFMTPSAWGLRTAGYFLIWAIFAGLIRKWSVTEEKTGDPRLCNKRVNLSSAGLVLFVLTVTFAATDWIMSINTHWFSTIYGAWFVVGTGLSAMSLGVFVVTRFGNEQPYRDALTPKMKNDWGNLMLMFTMLWAYTSLSQFLIIWAGNLPEFNPYYITRSQDGWNYIGIFTVVFQFFVPWVILFSPRVKKTTAYLGAVAAWIFFVRFFDVYWIVIPAARPGASAVPQVSDFLAVAGIGALFVGVWLTGMKGSILYPKYWNNRPKAFDAGAPREAAEHA
ncbi:MAG: hypothetical protein ACK4XJ_04195 [Fimbriimonadaceae bacterium]